MWNETMWRNIPEAYKQVILGGAFGAFLATVIVAAILIFIAFYVYQAWAWMAIAKKRKHKHPWLAWIPFGASAMRLQLGGFHWAWVFLWFFPPAAIALITVAIWRIFDKQKYPTWLSLSYPFMFIPKLGIFGIVYLVTIGFVAWKKK